MGDKRELGRFRQAVPALRLSVERGTDDVPDDGRFHVLMDGEIVLSVESKKEALLEYQAMRDRLLPPRHRAVDLRKLMAKEAAELEARTFLADSSRAKRAKALKKGGKGGSGGVG